MYLIFEMFEISSEEIARMFRTDNRKEQILFLEPINTNRIHSKMILG
jgi:hypothetical protein